MKKHMMIHEEAKSLTALEAGLAKVKRFLRRNHKYVVPLVVDESTTAEEENDDGDDDDSDDDDDDGQSSHRDGSTEGTFLYKVNILLPNHTLVHCRVVCVSPERTHGRLSDVGQLVTIAGVQYCVIEERHLEYEENMICPILDCGTRLKTKNGFMGHWLTKHEPMWVPLSYCGIYRICHTYNRVLINFQQPLLFLSNLSAKENDNESEM